MFGLKWNSDDCAFWQNDACVYPKTIKVCRCCFHYLKSGTHLTTELPLMAFVATKVNSNRALFISIGSLMIATLALFVSLVNLALRVPSQSVPHGEPSAHKVETSGNLPQSKSSP